MPPVHNHILWYTYATLTLLLINMPGALLSDAELEQVSLVSNVEGLLKVYEKDASGDGGGGGAGGGGATGGGDPCAEEHKPGCPAKVDQKT